MNKNNAIVVSWLNKEDFETLEDSTETLSGVSAVYNSASLLGGQLPKIANSIKGKAYLVYPWELPEIRETRLMRVKSWLKSKQIPLEDKLYKPIPLFPHKY